MEIRPILATVTKVTRSAPLGIQMTYIVSCLAVVESSQMIKVERSVLVISLQVNHLLLRQVARASRKSMLLLQLLQLLHLQ